MHEFFEYRGGILYWRVSISDRVRAGQATGCKNGRGYLITGINKKHYLVHRLIFLMHHDYLPPFIDHINGDRCDNCIENLRPATKAENNRNRGLSKANTSGYSGVCLHPRLHKWWARVYFNHKQNSLGCYDRIEDAHKAVLDFKQANHGEFLRVAS